MIDQPTAERQLVLSMLPAGPGECRFAVVVVLLSLAVFIAAAPFAGLPLPRVATFIPCYESALVINDLITTTLLFGQFTITRSPALLVLASGYLFTTLMTVAHALTFPELFAESGLLGGGSQTTAWLYMFRHGGFPIAVVGYALLEKSGTRRTSMPAPGAIALSVAAVLALVSALTALATIGGPCCPISCKATPIPRRWFSSLQRCGR